MHAIHGMGLRMYLSCVADAERNDGAAVGVSLQVRITALGDAREQVARLTFRGGGGSSSNSGGSTATRRVYA